MLLLLFLSGAHLNPKRGKIWTNIRLLQTQPIENIVTDTREDFKEEDASIGLQYVQHWDVESISFLHRMHPDVDTDSLYVYLSAALKKLYPSTDLKLGVKVKTPWDGKKETLRKLFISKIEYRQYIFSVKANIQQLLRN